MTGGLIKFVKLCIEAVKGSTLVFIKLKSSEDQMPSYDTESLYVCLATTEKHWYFFKFSNTVFLLFIL